MTRLLDGFNYFWDKTPTTWKPADIIFLHSWQKLLKEAVDKKEEPVEEDDMYEMAKKIFTP